MVPSAEWYFLTELRSLPLGRRWTATTTTPTTTTTATTRITHIRTIQPEEEAHGGACPHPASIRHRGAPADQARRSVDLPVSPPDQVLSPALGCTPGSISERNGFDRSRSDSTGSDRPQSAPMAGSSHATPSSSFGL